jgi:N-methylhydantoinase A
MLNIGVDVGGTFTDTVAIDESGNLFVGKAPTTPDHIVDGVIASLEDLARNAEHDLHGLLGATHFLGHGTTVGTNALVMRRGARTGLLITAGFEDTPFIQRAVGRLAGLSEEEMRRQVSLRQPVPLVKRECIAGVVERVDMNGRVLIPLLPDEAERAVRALLAQGVDAIAVCLLWSFLNPSHELMLAETIERLAPDLPVSLSTRLAPKMRENARCNTVVIDAFVGGVVKDYLSKLQKRLTEEGLRRSVASMQCFGGVTEAQYASPVHTIGSGPVGGVMGSKYLAKLIGEKNIITTDVGGTTFDVSVIWQGEEIIAREFFGAAGVMARFEVLTPRVDIQSIGAGGGTIAWFDSASRSIKFGPESAGSMPGPVFYGQGGTRVTLADAWLTLGYLDPERFLGGRLKVDADAARSAIDAQLAQPLGMSVTEAALAVVELANHHMSDAIKVYLGARGLDIRDFVMFAFGGGGPMHAAAYGELSGVKQTYLVANAEVFSALGVALADTKHKQQVTLLAREPFDLERVVASFAELEQRLLEQFEREGTAPASITTRYFLDLRYRGQIHELSVEIPRPQWITMHGMRAIRASFERQYRVVYGGASVSAASSTIELVGLGVDGVAEHAKPSLRRGQTRGSAAHPCAHREACFDARQGFQRVSVYADRDLAPQQEICGPAFVQNDYRTMLVLPGQIGRVDDFGNLVVDHLRGIFSHA